MAPFSKRQIGYIKAVAGVGQHKSFINYYNLPPSDSSVIDATTSAGEYTSEAKLVRTPSESLSTITGDFNFDENGKKLSGALFCLNNIPVTVDHTDAAGDINDQTLTQFKFGKALVPNKMLLLTQNSHDEGGEPRHFTSAVRVGEDFYVESTHIRWRFTMPDFTVAAGKQPHHEYRFVVFRQRKPTLQRGHNPTGDHAQWLNFNYDLFAGYQGRRVGWSGHRHHQEFDGDEVYSAEPVDFRINNTAQSQKLTTDDIMTMPLNDADYVIMRDERFFLGAEHGKSHYETVTRFDWSDPGSESQPNMISGMDDGKNYDWWFLLLGTSNDSVSPNLNISVRGTTAVTSA